MGLHEFFRFFNPALWWTLQPLEVLENGVLRRAAHPNFGQIASVFGRETPFSPRAMVDVIEI